MHSTPSNAAGSLSMYLSEINRFNLLTQDEERRLARLYRRSNDPTSAKQLVTSNLRFVVKVSYEYRSYGIRMADLIQEGNIGLMRAVEKFDPEKGIRLISYAVWWIRAYIQNYILRSWSLVKLGTTQAQRKLFFSLARTKRELEKLGGGLGGERLSAQAIAKKLKVRPDEVREMEQRMEGRDLSLDAPMGDDGGSSHVDFVVSKATGQEERLGQREEDRVVGQRVEEALSSLDDRERFIIEQRVMSDRPMTFKELGLHFGFSRERARQLEIRAKEKLKLALAQLMVELNPEESPEPRALPLPASLKRLANDRISAQAS